MQKVLLRIIVVVLGKTATALSPAAGKCKLCNVTMVPLTMDIVSSTNVLNKLS